MTRAAAIIRGARRRGHVSQTALAARSGTSQPAIARYEAGRVDPGVETLARLVSACGLRLEVVASDAFLGPIGRRLEDHRSQVLELCARHGAHDVRVFGSVARGEDRPESDVDLLVEVDSERTLLDLERLRIDLEDLLGVRVDVATERILRGGVSRRVARELRPL
jgi:predicted nucleotidyltransferase/DNA-binding XRE family transcriptional regulator